MLKWVVNIDTSDFYDKFILMGRKFAMWRDSYERWHWKLIFSLLRDDKASLYTLNRLFNRIVIAILTTVKENGHNFMK